MYIILLEFKYSKYSPAITTSFMRLFLTNGPTASRLNSTRGTYNLTASTMPAKGST